MANEILDYQGLDYFKYKLEEGLKQSLKDTGVSSFNGREGAVTPQSGDYTASMVGAVPTTRTVNGKALSDDITLSASDVSALPSTGGTLSGDLTIKGSGNYGTKINLGDGDYVHISEPEDDCMEIKAKKVNFVLSDTSNSKFTVNGSNPFGSSVSFPISVAKGGTGATTASSALYNIVSPLTARSQSNLSSQASSTYIPCYYGNTGYKATLDTLKNAIGGGGGGKVVVGSYVGTGIGSDGYSRVTLNINEGYNFIIVANVPVVGAATSTFLYLGVLDTASQQISIARFYYISGQTYEFTFKQRSITKTSTTVGWSEYNDMGGILNTNGSTFHYAAFYPS